MKWHHTRRAIKLTALALALWTVAGEVWPESMPRPANVARALIDAGTPNRLIYNASGTGLVTDLPAITASRVLISDANGLPTQNAALTANRVLLSDASGFPTVNAALTANRVLLSDASGFPTVNAALTASRALASDASGFPVASTTTATELGFVNGVTSGIQAQINTNSTNIAALRQKLANNRNYFVNASLGNDSNSGLSSGAGAFATIQKAVDVVLELDLGGKDVAINIADGTYTGFSVTKPLVGRGTLTFAGNASTPANVVVSKTNGHAIDCQNGCNISVGGMALSTSVGGGLAAIHATGRESLITVNTAVRLGATTGAHIQADYGGTIVIAAAYTITGSSTSQHVFAAHQSHIRFGTLLITEAGGLTHSLFAEAINLSYLEFNGTTFSGTATCTRYSVTGNAVLNTYGGGATFLPCGTAGSTASGGQYL